MSDAADNKGTMTSETYTKMVEEIEAEIKRVKAENNPDNKTKLTELKKEKRALKNKASAMRCREKKRRRMEDLEKTVAELNKKLLRLEQENKQLRAAASGSTTVAEPQKTVPASSTSKSAPVQRIHYAAPQKRRASDIITSSPRVSQQTSGSILKSSKLSHSRAHAVTTGTFSEADLDFSDVFASEDGGFGEDADAFLNGDTLPFWDEPAAGVDDAKVLDVVDTFFQDNSGRSLVGAL